MEDDFKISLMELIIGLREPASGMEAHFLKVIKNEAMPCSAEEKEWFNWWQKTQGKNKNVKKLRPSVNPTPLIKNNSQEMPERILKILAKTAKIANKSSDLLDSKKRYQGSYGGGKKSR
jgi:hypothetical protein